MSDRFTDLPGGTDGMTPFEAALAGQPPDSTDTPAVALVSELRALAASVEHAPVTQDRLEQFLSGGVADGGRPSAENGQENHAAPGDRPEPASNDTAFMDITPDDFADAPARPEVEEPLEAADEPLEAADEQAVEISVDEPIEPEGSPVAESPEPDPGVAVNGSTPPAEVPEDATDELSMGDLAAAAPIGADGHLGPAEPVPLSALPPLGPTDEHALAEDLTTESPLAEQPVAEEHIPDSGAVPADEADLDEAAFVPIDATPDIHRRPLKPLLAVAGSAMVAVVLLVGGIWWAQTLTDDNGPIGAASQSEIDGTDSADLLGTVAGTAEEADEPDQADQAEPETLEIEDTVPEAGADDASATGDETDNGEGADGDGSTDTTGGPTTTGNGDDGSEDPDLDDGRPSRTSDRETTTTRRGPATTAPEATTSTTERLTTTTRAIGADVMIGGRATLRGSSQRIPGVLVVLYRDSDNDGDPDFQIDSDLTASDGTYRFDAVGGCFSLEFTAAAGYEMTPGSERRNTCLSGPGQNLGLDVWVVTESRSNTGSAPIESCLADRRNNLGGSVQVVESDNRSADRYLFLGQDGLVVDTDQLGGPDVTYQQPDGSIERSWSAFDQFNRRLFRPEDVESVVAVRNGAESEPVSCSSDS